MDCEDVVITGPCLGSSSVNGSTVLNVEADGQSIACTPDGLQAIGGGFSTALPTSWSGLAPSCICPNAVRLVNSGTEVFAPELYAFQFSARDGINIPRAVAGETIQNSLGVLPAFQPGDPSTFHPVTGWDPARHSFNFGTVGSPILNPYCRPMFLWFLIRGRATANTGPGGYLVHKMAYSINGAPEVRYLDLTLPRSDTISVRYGSSVMRNPLSLQGVQIPPGGSFYMTVYNWVDQHLNLFSPLNEWFDSEIQIDAMALAYSGNPPANGCPPVGI